MINKFIDYFTPNQQQPITTAVLTEVQQSVVVLMVEIIVADHSLEDSEELLLRKLLQQHLEVADELLNEVIAKAKQDAKQSLDFYQHTKIIRAEYSVEEKQQLLEQLWSLAYADGNLDKHEDYVIRKIADLIYIPHHNFIKAKQSIKKNAIA